MVGFNFNDFLQILDEKDLFSFMVGFNVSKLFLTTIYKDLKNFVINILILSALTNNVWWNS